MKPIVRLRRLALSALVRRGDLYKIAPLYATYTWEVDVVGKKMWHHTKKNHEFPLLVWIGMMVFS